MKKYFLPFFVICSVASVAQSLNLASDNYLLLNGERFNNQKINFTKAGGDWYSASNDTHGAITFFAPVDGRELRLDIEWSGKDASHLITDEIRHKSRVGEFLITMLDKDTYGDGLNAYTSGDDELHINITKIDNLNISGEFTGTITQSNKKVKVGGQFNLSRKDAPKQLTSAKYKDCDNVIHDKLMGAQDRAPSDCEAKYDLDVRTAIHDALVPVVNKFKQDQWGVEKQTKLNPITEVPRGSEKDIFSSSYHLSLVPLNGSPAYADFIKQQNYLTSKTVASNDQEFSRVSHLLNVGYKLEMFIYVNNKSFSFSNYKGGAKVIRLASNAWEIQSAYVPARTGGGEDESVDCTFLLIGNWSQPSVEKSGNNGEQKIKSSPVLNPKASQLQAQNIAIRIESGLSTADDAIKSLDLQKLQSILQ